MAKCKRESVCVMDGQMEDGTDGMDGMRWDEMRATERGQRERWNQQAFSLAQKRRSTATSQ